MRDFSFLDMVDFFEGSNGGPGVFGFCSGVDGVWSVKDGGVGDGIFIGASGGRAIIVFVSSRHDREVEVREEGRVLIKVCEASGGDVRE